MGGKAVERFSSAWILNDDRDARDLTELLAGSILDENLWGEQRRLRTA